MILTCQYFLCLKCFLGTHDIKELMNKKISTSKAAEKYLSYRSEEVEASATFVVENNVNIFPMLFFTD